MRWPVGRYNGRKIVGCSLKVKIDVTEWRWVPWYCWNGFTKGFHWFCFYSWFEWEYE